MYPNLFGEPCDVKTVIIFYCLNLTVWWFFLVEWSHFLVQIAYKITESPTLGHTRSHYSLPPDKKKELNNKKSNIRNSRICAAPFSRINEMRGIKCFVKRNSTVPCIYRNLKTKWFSIRLKKQSLRITVTCDQERNYTTTTKIDNNYNSRTNSSNNMNRNWTILLILL